ncbi:hypothetical protein A1D23_00525 [Chelonobacter oris]|uniref:VENN motif pre-toxin domain-containing protein n=1 Tax=Chelonobacter oris TaxID=505317 RepID=UPI0024471D75|nr:VENN motif pre-toxin domain-containing protein [Chelonobacter oris]MDH3000049.1 hypothetical protein [Chelonobacter oris]
MQADDEINLVGQNAQDGFSKVEYSAVAIYGSGSNASANASLSNVKADSAQVTEQTGLFIGKEGMDLTVNGKLKTKGGAITSSAPAEKNHLRVAGIEAENIENHSHISVENASVGVSTQMGTNVANAIGAGLNALTNLHDNDHTTTRSTVGSNITLDVGDGNIPTALSRDASNSNQQVKQFDKQDYQERAEMAQVISAVSDNTITLTLKPKLDDAEKVLNNDKATEAEKAQARQVVETYGKGSDLQLAIRAVTAAAQGLATGSAASAAVGGASPFLNKAIKQATTDENGQVNQSANLLAHAVLGAAEALATGNNALAGAAGAATGEVAAKLITEQIYNTTPDKLSEAQKDTVSALSQLASGLSGVLAGDNTASGITAAQSGKSAVENNLLSNWDSEELLKILNKFDQNGALSTFEQEKAMSLLLKDSEIDRLIQLHQKNPEALTDSQKAYLYREAKNIANSYPNLTASDVLNWDFSANTVKRDNTKIIHYLNNENLLANTVEHRISEGVYEGMQYMPFTYGVAKAAQNTVIRNTAIGLGSNASLQALSGQDFDWYEFGGAGLAGAITPKLSTRNAIRINMGISMGVSLANGGNPLQDTSLSGIGAWAGTKIKYPILGNYVSEFIQKSPLLLKEQLNNIQKDQ